MRILVTGANGYLGSYLVNYLTIRGYDVFASVRSISANGTYSLSKDKIISFDLEKPILRKLPEAIDIVIHTAAATSEKVVDEEKCRSINVDGTSKLLELCENSGVDKFIFISSMSVSRENPSNYAKTKYEAELIVNGSKIKSVIIRPGLIIGNGNQGIFNKMAKQIDQLPIVPIIGDNKNLCTVDMMDLCHVIELSASTSLVDNMTFDVCANESLGILDIAKIIAKRNHYKRVYLPISYGVAMAIARISTLLGKSIITTDNVYGLKFARKPDLTILHENLKFYPKLLLDYIYNGQNK